MESRRASILIIEDDVDTCANLHDILSDLGYEVEAVHDGTSALKCIENRTFDVALIDLNLPDIDGLTLYRRLKQQSPGTVAIIVSAYANKQTADEALHAGAWQVLAKPVDPAALVELVEDVLGQPLLLVVDDDQELCQSLWDLLRERGFRVCLAGDRTSAAERLAQRTYDVVLIDMKLPGGDGREVLRLVQQSNPEARTVLITGYKDELMQAVEQARREGADAVFYKPFDIPKLLQTVDRLTSNGRAR